MNMNLRTKILLSVGITIFIVLGVSTGLFIQNLKRNYLEAIQWRSEALAQTIVRKIVAFHKSGQEHADGKVESFLSKLNEDFENLYTLNKEKDITHIAFLDQSGNIASHNDSTLRNSPLKSSELTQHLEQQNITTVLDGIVYHTLIPLFDKDNTYLGTVDIGFPKATVDRKVRQLLWQVIMLLCLFLVIAFFSISLLLHILVTKPIRQLVEVGEQLAKGNLELNIKSSSNDEIATIGKVFTRISIYMQYIAYVASLIATGEIDREVRTRSEHDSMGHAIQNMVQYLQEGAAIVKRVSEGDLTHNTSLRSESDTFGRVLQTMTNGLRSLIRQIRKSAAQIAETGKEIAALSVHDTGIVKKVETSVDDMVLSTTLEVGESAEKVAEDMDTLAEATEETSVSVAQMTQSISRIVSNTGELNQQTQQTIMTLNEAVSALNKVVENTELSKKLSQETLQDAHEGEQAVEEVMRSMEAIQTVQNTTENAITSFALRSQEIRGIVDVIREIAEQTSLLALNASIIAAQSGSHGRGFAVIADEIKNLAERVTSSTKDITSIVNTVHQETENVVQMIRTGTAHVHQGVERTQHARQMLHKIITSAKRSSGVVTEIATALNKQMTTSLDLVADMKKVNSMTAEITSETKDQETSTFQIKQAIDAILNMASQTQEATTRQRIGVQKVIDSLNDVAALIYSNMESSKKISQTADELASQSDILLQAINRFVL